MKVSLTISLLVSLFLGTVAMAQPNCSKERASVYFAFSLIDKNKKSFATNLANARYIACNANHHVNHHIWSRAEAACLGFVNLAEENERELQRELRLEFGKNVPLLHWAMYRKQHKVVAKLRAIYDPRLRQQERLFWGWKRCLRKNLR